MKIQSLLIALLLSSAPLAHAADARMDGDLKDVTIQELQQFYQGGTYTARQVTDWHIARIEQLNPKYRAMVDVYSAEAQARASELDAAAKSGGTRGALWGVPVVIKGNTAIEGKIIGNGWIGYAREPNALVAKRDATF